MVVLLVFNLVARWTFLSYIGGALLVAVTWLQPLNLAAQKQQSFEGATISNKLEKLPQRVRTMRDEIYRAARSGDLLVLREVLEVNELHPLTGSADERDPIKFWKKTSADGEGAQIMAPSKAAIFRRRHYIQ